MTYELHDIETQTTDEATGGRKGVKLTQVGALDPIALIALARVAGHGASKYAAFNYLKGYDWSKSFDAMQRHAMLFWAGEEIDPESGQPHITMAAWHALALTSFQLRRIGTDNRPPSAFEAPPLPMPDMGAGPSGYVATHPGELNPYQRCKASLSFGEATTWEQCDRMQGHGGRHIWGSR